MIFQKSVIMSGENTSLNPEVFRLFGNFHDVSKLGKSGDRPVHWGEWHETQHESLIFFFFYS